MCRNQSYILGTFRACCAKSKVTSCSIEDNAAFVEPQKVRFNTSLSSKRCYVMTRGSPMPCRRLQFFSTQAGTESSEEEDDDLEAGVSERQTPVSAGATQDSNGEAGNDDEFSELEISEDEINDDVEGPQNEMELSDTEPDVSREKSRERRGSNQLFRIIVTAPGLSVHNALEKWVEEGNELTRPDILLAMLFLRRRRMYGRALQLSEYVESTKKVEFLERDYASRVDLIAKVRGVHKAENYIEKIPKSFRGEVVYRTLLANCVLANNVKKSEQVFSKMKDLEFPITCFACNQLLLLYKRVDKKKIADVLLLMEKEKVKPSLFTYRILIDTKGQSNDIAGMDQIVETMKAEGIEPDLATQALLAKHYVLGGLKEKAEPILKQMEGGNAKENRWACRSLLPLYATLGKADDVERLWNICKPNPRIDECIAAIEAWGKLNNVEEAEAVFDKMVKTWKKLSSKHYTAMLKVYANHKMLAKGKDLVKQIGESGCRIGPLTWDALVKLYVEAGEVEKADSILLKAARQNQIKPMFSSYMTIMEQYARRGDVHNAEKMFHRMRQAGYQARIRPFQCLIQTYLNAKVPAYGMRERLIADNVFPNKALAAQLASADAFRKTAVSELLD
ncbi:hypothetical protein RJ639_018663 [Escallonia herrerae]|uniref:PROP1-like PPR domain-containing protein n=1 Tax=Escallonia herrerae TaxID=1293975 RepID=A0AA88V900_9ASTE|nr:hypothetical protein RJ639_018663 [Escallonia herrerae]